MLHLIYFIQAHILKSARYRTVPDTFEIINHFLQMFLLPQGCRSLIKHYQFLRVPSGKQKRHFILRADFHSLFGPDPKILTAGILEI